MSKHLPDDDCCCDFDDSCWGTVVDGERGPVFVRLCLNHPPAGNCACTCPGVAPCPGCDSCSGLGGET